MRTGILLLSLGLLLGSCGSTRAESGTLTRLKTETPLPMTMQEKLRQESDAWSSYDPDYQTISPHGKSVVLQTTPQGRVLSIDGMPGETFTRIPEPVHFLADDSICYLALRGAKPLVVRNTTAGEPLDGIKLLMAAEWMPTAAVMDADRQWGDMGMIIPRTGVVGGMGAVSQSYLVIPGKHVIYVAKRHGKQLVIYDGVESQPYDRIGEVLFSEDGAHYAFTAKRGSSWQVVRDGVPQAVYDRTISTRIAYIYHDVAFSRDGRHLTYRVQKQGKQLVVVDRKEYVEGDPAIQPFLEDIERIDYQSYQLPNEIPTAITCEVTSTPHGAAKTAKPVAEKYPEKLMAWYNDAGALYAFATRRNGKMLVVVGGKEEPAFDEVMLLQGLATGQGVAYIARNGKRYFVVRNGKTGPVYEKITSLHVSMDGTRLAYPALKGGQQVMVVDGQESAPAKMFDDGSFAFTPDSQHYYYRVGNEAGRQQMVVDGVGTDFYSAVDTPVTFGPQGYWACGVQYDGKQSILYSATNDPGSSYDEIYPDAANSYVSFDTPTQFHYLARRGNTLLRVDEWIPDADTIGLL